MTAPQTQAAAPSLGDFLLGGASRAGRSLSFKQTGTSHTGTISSAPEIQQQRDPETGDPKSWPDGNPMWQIVVPLQTTYRSADIEDDDGVRFLYVDGSKKPESRSKHVAVANAVRAAGAKGLEIGGQLTITYTGDGPKSPGTSAVSSPPKQYQATYVAPANASLMGQAEQPAAPQAPTQAAAPVRDETGSDPALLAAMSHLPVEQQNAFIAAGLTADQIKAMGV